MVGSAVFGSGYDSSMGSSRLVNALRALSCVSAVLSGCATNADAMRSLRTSAEPLLESHPAARSLVESNCAVTPRVSVTKQELTLCSLTVQALVDLTSIALGPTRGDTVLSEGLRTMTAADAVVAARIKALAASTGETRQPAVASLIQLLGISKWLSTARHDLLVKAQGPWPARAGFAVDVSGLVDLALSTPESEVGLEFARAAQLALIRRSQMILELTETEPDRAQ